MPMTKKILKIGCLLSVVVLGLLLGALGFVDWRQVLAISEAHADRTWLPVVLVLGQMLLYAFALPGTGLIFIVGVLYKTWLAAIIIAAGGLLGGICAYWVAKQGGAPWVKRIEKSRYYELLQSQGDMLTLTTLRCLPMFPHSVINYSSGMLRIPWSKFIASTAIGFAVKGYVYASALYQASHAQTLDELITFKTLLPLLVLAVMMILAKLIRYQWKITRD